jgi:hypothetical protein
MKLKQSIIRFRGAARMLRLAVLHEITPPCVEGDKI